MRHPRSFVALLVALLLCLMLIVPASAKSATYRTGFTRWRAAEGAFGFWTRSGVALKSDVLQLDLKGASAETDLYPTDGYYGGNFYNAGSFKVGVATSPVVVVPSSFAFTEAIASWNANTPAGTW